MRTVRRIAFITLAPTFLVWALLAAQLWSRHHLAPKSTSATRQLSIQDDSAAVPPGTGAAPDQDDQPLADQSETDLYGNQINDAVAEYGLDSAGSLYEMHAPRVELPHLPSPKS